MPQSPMDTAIAAAVKEFEELGASAARKLFSTMEEHIAAKTSELTAREQELIRREETLNARERALAQAEDAFHEHERTVAQREKILEGRESEFTSPNAFRIPPSPARANVVVPPLNLDTQLLRPQEEKQVAAVPQAMGPPRPVSHNPVGPSSPLPPRRAVGSGSPTRPYDQSPPGGEDKCKGPVTPVRGLRHACEGPCMTTPVRAAGSPAAPRPSVASACSSGGPKRSPAHTAPRTNPSVQSSEAGPVSPRAVNCRGVGKNEDLTPLKPLDMGDCELGSPTTVCGGTATKLKEMFEQKALTAKQSASKNRADRSNTSSSTSASHRNWTNEVTRKRVGNMGSTSAPVPGPQSAVGKAPSAPVLAQKVDTEETSCCSDEQTPGLDTAPIGTASELKQMFEEKVRLVSQDDGATRRRSLADIEGTPRAASVSGASSARGGRRGSAPLPPSMQEH